MAVIKIKKNNVLFEETIKTFFVSGKGIPFGTKHTLLNEKTNGSMDFDLSHSDGSEWNPNTNWIYKSLNGHELWIRNDDVTKEQSNNYLKAKMRN